MNRKLLLSGIMSLLLASVSFAQQMDMSLIPYRIGNKWGYATADRKVVIQPKYDDASWFSEGLASVLVGKKYGYINKQGKMVIPAKFTVAKPFRKGYMPNIKDNGGDSIIFAGASLQANGYEICINVKGNRMPKCPAINENSVIENRSPVEIVTTQKTYSIPNNNGLFDKIVDDYKIPGNDETYYVAVKDNRYGVFNSKFDTVVPFEYSSIKLNRNAGKIHLLVNKGGMFGIARPDGTIAIEPEYSNLNFISANDSTEYVIIQKNDKTYVKDLKNRDIISSGFSDISYDDAGGFVITGDNNLRGYYFMNNNVIQPRYKNVNQMRGGRFLVVETTDGKRGYISNTGDEYFEK